MSLFPLRMDNSLINSLAISSPASELELAKSKTLAPSVPLALMVSIPLAKRPGKLKLLMLPLLSSRKTLSILVGAAWIQVFETTRGLIPARITLK